MPPPLKPFQLLNLHLSSIYKSESTEQFRRRDLQIMKQKGEINKQIAGVSPHKVNFKIAQLLVKREYMLYYYGVLFCYFSNEITLINFVFTLVQTSNYISINIFVSTYLYRSGTLKR